MPIDENALNDKVEKLKIVVSDLQKEYQKSETTLHVMEQIRKRTRREEVAATATDTAYARTVRDVTPTDRVTNMPMTDKRRDELYEQFNDTADALIAAHPASTEPAAEG